MSSSRSLNPLVIAIISILQISSHNKHVVNSFQHASQLTFPFSTRPKTSLFLHHNHNPSKHHPNKSTSSLQVSRSTEPTTTSSSTLPRLTKQNLLELSQNDIITIPNFLPPNLVSSLRNDVETLRTRQKFRTAKIGQDSTNTLDQNIRIAETVFLGRSKLRDCPDESRNRLYDVLDGLCDDLSSNTILQQPPVALDENLSELLYAYYPQGGFYRRHRDAIPNSASTLRVYSLLLYLNEDWTVEDGGQLRVHRDGGGDFLPERESPNYVDIEPRGGTLVLFKSDRIPHEVLDTTETRVAVVGWFNRAVTVKDIGTLSSGGTVRSGMLVVSALLILVGLASLLS